MKHCEIDLIIDKNYKPSNKFIKKNFNTISYEKFENNYDLLLYHMGNNPFHEYVYKFALKHPGVVVLHDPFLHHLQVHMTIAEKNPNGYREIVEYCLGAKGKKIAENALISYSWPHFEYPLIKKLVDSSIGVIVHSKFAKRTILQECRNRFIKQIKMPIISTAVSKSDVRKKLKIPENCLVIGTFGHVGFYKRTDMALKSFAKFLKSHPNSIFLIVGGYQTKAFETEIHHLVKKLGIENNVIATGYVDNLFPYIQISDIIVQLRYPTAGETSIITLQIMGLGKPTLVSNIGSFSELPENTVIKINVDKNEENLIFNAFLKLSQIEYRKKLGQNAHKYVETEHNPEKIAYEFFDFFSYVKNKERIKFMSNVACLMDELGVKNVQSTDLDALAQKLHKILP